MADNNPITAAAATPNNLQYIRNFKLTVFGTNLVGIDLSQLHCKFSVKRSSNQTPNCADIRVYNLDANTALQIKNQFKRVILQAGYDSNYGVIFKGNIKQVIIGRESATDTFIDLNCGDGDLAYNYAVVNTTLAAGSSQMDQLNQIAQPMYALGVTPPQEAPDLQPLVLPRGKAMWGGSKDYMRNLAQQNAHTWALQNGQLQLVHQKGYAKGVSVILTSKTGMIGTPEQTDIGINVVCLINPRINPGQTIKVDQASIAQLKIDLGNHKDPVNLAVPLRDDGVYNVLVVEQTGDTRGVDWYSKLICLSIAVAGNPINSVPVSYGP